MIKNKNGKKQKHRDQDDRRQKTKKHYLLQKKEGSDQEGYGTVNNVWIAHCSFNLRWKKKQIDQISNSRLWSGTSIINL